MADLHALVYALRVPVLALVVLATMLFSTLWLRPRLPRVGTWLALTAAAKLATSIATSWLVTPELDDRHHGALALTAALLVSVPLWQTARALADASRAQR